MICTQLDVTDQPLPPPPPPPEDNTGLYVLGAAALLGAYFLFGSDNK
jgi:hypothetical protein